MNKFNVCFFLLVMHVYGAISTAVIRPFLKISNVAKRPKSVKESSGDERDRMILCKNSMHGGFQRHLLRTVL